MDVQETIERVYREQSRQIFATLVRLVGDFDRAEEALHEAFAIAVRRWPEDGVPANPAAWLISAGRFRSIDAARRAAKLRLLLPGLPPPVTSDPEPDLDEAAIRDDQLRLIFTCCHPALAPEARIALTLREVCGLTTEEVAAAFLAPTPTIAQRIVRAKTKIRDARIPYVVPGRADLPERLDSVLAVVYLVYNEGYSASAGDAAIRGDLSREAIRLGRHLRDLLPDPEALGLVALMLLHESRRPARTDARGDLVLLEDQDRTLWDAGLAEEGRTLVEEALRSGRVGVYTVQAAIAAVHSEATTADATDWPQIVALYDVLERIAPSPIVALNRAVAVAMRDGPEAGLALVDAILAEGALGDYHLAHSARADLCRRLGRTDEARSAYRQALDLSRQEPERRYLARRLAELSSAG